tara:strand:+ start:1429 stop:1593 length:165 start_codon:yes stop_codon:yes gene_type:complete
MAYNCTEHGTVYYPEEHRILNEDAEVSSITLFCPNCYLEFLQGTRSSVNEVTEE